MNRDRPAQISVALPHERRESLRLAGQTPEYAQFLEELAEASPVAWEGMLAARRDGRIVGALWSQLLPGRAGLILAPQLLPYEPDATAERLLAAGCQALRNGQALLVQALVQPADGQGRARLLRGGFVQAAELSYLVSPRPSQTAAAPSGVLEFEPYNADQESRLAALIGATYDGTLDCPLLNGLRSLPDVLAGYRTVGAYRPEDWQFVRRSGHDVGCLLLAEHPAADHTELIYMGLVPAARGCGLGREITLRALYLAARRGQSLVLAVDAANTPACALYAGAGLVEWDRRAVLLRAWNERGEEQPLTARQVT